MENKESSPKRPQMPLGLGYFLLPPHPTAPPRPSQPFDFRNLGASFSAPREETNRASQGRGSPTSSATDESRTCRSDEEDCPREDSPDISFSLGDRDSFRRRGSDRPDLPQWPVNLGVQFINPSTGKKRVQCNVCLKTFCDKGALKIHFSAVHLREMHKCTVEGCTMMFSSRRSRNRHSANPNPKLHSPHTRRKISAHDGRSAQPFPLLPLPLPLLPPLPRPGPPPAPFGEFYRREPRVDVAEEANARKEEEKIQKLADINKFLADYQKYGQEMSEKPPAPEVPCELSPVNDDEPQDLSMPSKRSDPDPVKEEEVDQDEPISLVSKPKMVPNIIEEEKPAVFVPNKRKRKSEKPIRCSQSSDLNHSDEDVVSEMYREDIKDVIAYENSRNNNTFHSIDGPLSLKMPKIEKISLNNREEPLEFKREINDNIVDSKSDIVRSLNASSRSNGEKIRLRSDLYEGETKCKNEFREPMSLMTARSPSAESERETSSVETPCHAEDLNALEIPIDEENPDKCTACGQVFQNHFLLRIHFRNVHLKLLHQCDIDGCNAAFPSKRSRDRHSSNMSLHRKLLSTSSPDHRPRLDPPIPGLVPGNGSVGFDADLLNRLYADIKGLASTLETMKYHPYGGESVPSLPVFVSEAVQQYWRRAGAGGRDARSPLSASSPPVISPGHADPPRDENNPLFRESSEPLRRMTSLCERQEQMYQHHVPVS